MSAAKVQSISTPEPVSPGPVPARINPATPGDQDSATQVERIQELNVLDLVIAPWNARKSSDPAGIDELKRSIQAHGVQVPLLVRLIAGRLKDYEIVCGHRRYESACALNRHTVPCIVRELTDDQAREIGLVDNLQREDVPALEEADAYRELQSRLGSPAAIAARVGKDVSYVARRLQLVSLAELPRKALAERLITVDHALLLARLGADEQDGNLKWTLNTNAGIKVPVEDVIQERIKDRNSKDRWAPWEPQSPLELKHHVEQNVGRKLSRAPWSLDDANLVPDVGACSVCPSNTKANDTLFGDMAIAAATCENGACFESKRVAFVQIRLSKATTTPAVLVDASKGPAIRLSWKSTTVKPRASKPGGAQQWEDDGFSLFQTFKYGQWIDAKKGSCEYLRAGVTVDWSDAGNRGYMGSDEKLSKPGQILLVCIAEKCKVHKKGYGAEKRENGGGYDAKAEEAKREKLKQAAIVESKLRIAVASKALEAVKVLPAEALRAIVLDAVKHWRERAMNALLPGFLKTLKTAKVDSVEFARAAALASISDNLEAHGHQGADTGRKEFIADVKRLGYDGSSAWLKPAEPKPEKKAAANPAVKAAVESIAKPAKKAILSPAAKKRIADAQRKRWAKAKVKKGGR